jgi:hypothetical protein
MVQEEAEGGREGEGNITEGGEEEINKELFYKNIIR